MKTKKTGRRIYPAKAKRKLMQAKEEHKNIYLYGATGYGKTSLVTELLKNEIDIFYDGTQEVDFSLLAELQKKELYCVVIDNLQCIRSIEKQKELYQLERRSDIWLILIGRAAAPKWMQELFVNRKLFVIEEKDLWFSAEDLTKLAGLMDIPVEPEDAQFIAKASQGNAYCINLVLQYLQTGKKLDQEAYEKMRQDMCSRFEYHVIRQWDADLQEFAMKLSVVDSFTIELAKELTGDPQTLYMIEQMFEAGNFVEGKNGIYTIRDIFLEAIRLSAEKQYGERQMNELRNIAGRYYELQDDVITALKLYESSGAKENIKALLIRNARKNPGAGFYYELRHYYFSLSEEDVRDSVVLMSALCIVYSMSMQIEESEYWYDRVVDFAKNASGGAKREAERYVIFLQISLAHRGSEGLINIIKGVPKLLWNKGNDLPEASVTSNLPSVVNGGKDFCEWTKKDLILASSFGKLLERVLGRFGKGLVHVGLGESFFEKGMDNYEVLNNLSRAQMESENGGKLEIQFVAIGIQIRLAIVNGQTESAYSLLDSFAKKLDQQKLWYLQNNVEALRCRLALYTARNEEIEEWMKAAPDETKEFCYLERYRYMTKLRVYIHQGKYMEAMALIGKMDYYAEINHRTYIKMELGLLRAILFYRTMRPWEEELEKTLDQIYEYRFIRIVTEEGAGIWPLLKELEKKKQYSGKKKEEWFKKILKETKIIADNYPAYEGGNLSNLCNFKEIELKILRLQAEGLTFKKIAETVGLSERMTKYYAAENYKRLGVHGKTDAVVEAKKRSLL